MGAILSVLPLDTFVDDFAGRMEVVDDPDEIPPVQAEVQAEIDRAEGRPRPMISIERFAFYDLAAQLLRRHPDGRAALLRLLHAAQGRHPAGRLSPEADPRTEPIVPGAADERPAHPAWASLPLRARLFRVAHVAWGAVALTGLAYIWTCAIVRRRDRYLWAAVVFLLVQGVFLVIGRGNCPFGPFQRRLGDPVPMFELVLPPRAAKAAIPVLLVVSVAGMVAAALRRPVSR